MTQGEIIQILAAFAGSAGFCVLFNIRGIRLVGAAVGGLLSWTLFVILNKFIASEPVCYFVVAWAVSVYAEILARVMKTPTTPFIIASLVPLIPGGSLYYTMSHAFGGDMDGFLQKGINTLQLASALALGVIVSSAISKVIGDMLKNKKMHK